ncbi:T9SS type A sorting domain-containing protein [bacterium]|nr:T9SS type A sorting domain-containing protein [bacterium]
MTPLALLLASLLLLLTAEAPANPTQMWAFHSDQEIFHSAALTNGPFAYAGSHAGDNNFARQFLIAGDGSPAFSVSGQDWTVAASATGDYWAAADNESDNSVVFSLWASQSNESLGEYSFEGVMPYGQDMLRFSADGATLAGLFGDAATTRVIVWDVPWQVPGIRLLYESFTPVGGPPNAFALSGDGAIVAFIAGQHCHVLNTMSLQIYGVSNIQEQANALDLSQDGSLIAYGYSEIRLKSFNGTSYSTEWTQEISGYHCQELMFSPSGDYLASSWTKNDNSRILIRLYDLETGEEIWTFETPESASNLQDAAVSLDMSSDGNWLAVGTWGRGVETLPEVHVFHRGFSVPYFSLDMPGSCLDVRLSPDGNYLMAGGTHQHTTANPAGGDLFMIDLDLESLEPSVGVGTMIEEFAWFVEDPICGIDLSAYNSGFVPVVFDTVYWLEDSMSGRPVSLGMTPGLLNPGQSAQAMMTFSPQLTEEFQGSLAWVLEFTDPEGVRRISDTLLIFASFSHLVAVDPSAASPLSYELLAPYPNPFNSTTTVSFSLPIETETRLRVFDVLGRAQGILAEGRMSAGVHTLNWNANSLPSGLYLLQLETSLGIKVQKTILLK